MEAPSAGRTPLVRPAGRLPGKSVMGLGASLTSVAAATLTTPVMGQNPNEEACAFVLELRSPYTVERVLSEFPNDPCVPIMLAGMSPRLLARISPELVAALPPSQLRRVPPEVLAKLGIRAPSTRSVAPTTNRPRPAPKPRNTSPY